MSGSIRTVRKCTPYLPSALRKQVVQTLVLCHLDYCSVIWASASKAKLNRLQVVQNRAARLALCTSYRSNVDKMHSLLKWPKVQDRLSIRSLMFLKNIISTGSPQTLSKEICFCCDAHSHRTRSATTGQIVLPRWRNKARKKTALYRSISLWNKTPLHIRGVTVKRVFKKLLKSHFNAS